MFNPLGPVPSNLSTFQFACVTCSVVVPFFAMFHDTSFVVVPETSKNIPLFGVKLSVPVPLKYPILFVTPDSLGVKNVKRII
jgi:hypothetical protein